MIFNQDIRILTKSLNFLVVILFLSALLMKSQAKKMDEAVCMPRPVAVAVTEGHEVIPYHVILHRCSGTCGTVSPHVKSCEPLDAVEIELDIRNEIQNEKGKVKVTNHTSCICNCKCRDNGVVINHKSCTCMPDLSVDARKTTGARKGDDDEIPKPYLLGIVFVGAFAVFVLIFDVTLLVKKKGFINTVIKHTCCGSRREKSKNSPADQQEIMLNSKCNGQTNGNCKQTEV